MGDASTPGEDWPGYLRRMTRRPGWSVARLARDSGIHRATIFGWIKGDSGVTLDSVRRVADALGDSLDSALRAAGGGMTTEPVDGDSEEIDLIMRAPVGDEIKERMLVKLRERRERDRLQRIEDFQSMIDLAKRED